MTTSRPVGFFALCSATVFLVPFFFVDFHALDTETARVMSPVLLILELICYGLWIGLFTRSTVFLICLIPLTAAFFRFVLALMGGIAANAIGRGDVGTVMAALWFGHPVSVIAQMGVSIYLIPRVLALATPGVLIDTRYEFLVQSETSSEIWGRGGRKPEVGPSGGVYHIYSLDDMDRYFNKVAGLEGFAIFTNEWLPYYHNLPAGHATELLGVRLQELMSRVSGMSADCDLEEPERIMLETAHYKMFYGPITDQFFGLFLFKAGVSLDSCNSRLRVMVDSARTFFSTRYVK